MEWFTARDRKAVETAKQNKADWDIVVGLDKQGYSKEKISEMMGTSESHVNRILEGYRFWQKPSFLL